MFELATAGIFISMAAFVIIFVCVFFLAAMIIRKATGNGRPTRSNWTPNDFPQDTSNLFDATNIHNFENPASPFYHQHHPSPSPDMSSLPSMDSSVSAPPSCDPSPSFGGDCGCSSTPSFDSSSCSPPSTGGTDGC